MFFVTFQNFAKGFLSSVFVHSTILLKNAYFLGGGKLDSFLCFSKILFFLSAYITRCGSSLVAAKNVNFGKP